VCTRMFGDAFFGASAVPPASQYLV
jgi:hypothetical protein